MSVQVRAKYEPLQTGKYMSFDAYFEIFVDGGLREKLLISPKCYEAAHLIVGLVNGVSHSRHPSMDIEARLTTATNEAPYQIRFCIEWGTVSGVEHETVCMATSVREAAELIVARVNNAASPK